MSIELHQLRIFTLIAEKKSFTVAAEAVLLSQPTVSSHIRNLEEALDVTLFDRLPRGVELTSAGEILYRHSRELLARHKAMLDAIREHQGTIGGTVDVGGSTIPGEYLIPGLLGELRREAPEIVIELAVADTRAIIAEVIDGRLEVGLVGADPKSDLIESSVFCKDDLVLIAPPGHPLAKRRSPTIAWKEFAGEPLWLREPGSGTRQSLERALEKRGLSLATSIVAGHLGTTEAIKRAVMGGAGLSVVSAVAVQHERAAGLLHVLHISDLALDRHFHVIRHRQRTPSPAARFVYDFLVQAGKRFALP